MANEVDASVNPVESSLAHPPFDRSPADSTLQELPDGDETELGGRQTGDLAVDAGRSVDFSIYAMGFVTHRPVKGRWA
jgi:hypothetical protein